MHPYDSTVLLAIASLSMSSPSVAQQAPLLDFAITNVRIFDGERSISRGTVVVSGGLIKAAGARVPVPTGARIIDGQGMTVVPGLIDAHVHYLEPRNLQQALVFGVTTELDMGTQPEWVAAARQRQSSAAGEREADIRTAGSLLTAPSGHGTEYGLKLSTIDRPDQADQRVQERIGQGSDYIKIVLDDGKTYKPLPTLNDDTLRAVIAAAHRRGRKAIVHIGSASEAARAIDAGADGLAHLFVDAPPPRGFARQLRRHGAFAVPNLTTAEKIVDKFDRSGVLGNPALEPFMAPSDIADLKRSFPVRAAIPVRMEFANATVRALRAAGVPILAGSDSAKTHGPMLHRELELLVAAGLRPSEALAAATSAPAAQFGLADRGRIRSGARADLLLVKGNPLADIRALRDIQGVWKAGKAVDRQAFAASLAKERAADQRLRDAPPPAGSESGLVSTFDDGAATARFGTGWTALTDQVAGGKSVASLAVVPAGAQGTSHGLRVTGEVRPGFAFGFAGVMFNPGPRPFTPANLSGRKLSFWARGDGKTYGVMVSSRSYGMPPVTRRFVATPGWTRYEFPLSAFDGMEGYDVTSIQFASGPRVGAFDFQLDEVRLDR